MAKGKVSVRKQGVGNPKMTGMVPKVVRGDATRAILPKGMVNSKVVDESAGGESIKFKGV